MPQFEDLYRGQMIDVETTGLVGHRNRMTSLAVLRYEVDRSNFSVRVADWLHMRIGGQHPNRVDNPETMEWRAENRVGVMEERICLVAESPKCAMAQLNHFIERGELLGYTSLVCKHPQFDMGFIKSYMADTGNVPFWPHWNEVDLASLKLIVPKSRDEWGAFKDQARHKMLGDETLARAFQLPEFVEHDALTDCYIQVCEMAEVLRYAKETIEELTQRCDLLLMALERIAKHQEAVSAPFSDNSTAGSIARAAIAAVEEEK